MKPDCFIRAADLEELKGVGPHAVSADGIDVVVVRTDAGPRAFSGRCPHQGALLGEGEFDGRTLVCRNHRWRFDVGSGRREGGPECLAACPVDERAGALYVDVSTLSAGAKVTAAKRTLDDLPGPKGLPLLGNLHQFDISKFHLVLETWAAKYGPAFVFRVGRRRIVVIADPVWREHALRARPETFRRAVKLDEVVTEIGYRGVFTAEGEAWGRQRRLVIATLAQRNIKGLYDKIRTVCDRLLLRWRGFADADRPVDVVAELQRFTVDVTTLITFGYDINTIEREDGNIQSKLNLIFPTIIKRSLAAVPIWRYVTLPRDRRFIDALSQVGAFIDDLIASERDLLALEPERAERPSNFIQAMLSARDDEGNPFSREVIRGNLMTMLLAGEDTTANTAAWSVHELCDHPEAAAALRDEADALLDASGVAADFETANALERAGAVANETMRLRPVAPVLGLETQHDTVVGDLALPAGTTVAVLMRPAALENASFVDPLGFRPSDGSAIPRAGATPPRIFRSARVQGYVRGARSRSSR